MTLAEVLQAASNAAAQNVSGPVDLLTMLLQKGGVPVPSNAVGSTQWMREKGLYRDVDDTASRLTGETLGIIGPLVAAAKAPQIARGLLAVQENAAAPGAVNRGMAAGQRGVASVTQKATQVKEFDVYRGSNNDVDEFVESPLVGGQWFTADKDHARHFGDVKSYKLRFNKPVVIDGEKVIGSGGYEADYRLGRILEAARKKGYDGAIIKNWEGAGDNYIAFDASQIMKAE